MTNTEAVKWLMERNLANINLVHLLAVHPEASKLLNYMQNNGIVAFSESDFMEFMDKMGVKYEHTKKP